MTDHDALPLNSDVLQRFATFVAGMEPGPFTLTYQGPAIREYGGMDVKDIGPAMLGLAGLVEMAQEALEKPPVELCVAGFDVDDDKFTVRFDLKLKEVVQ